MVMWTEVDFEDGKLVSDVARKGTKSLRSNTDLCKEERVIREITTELPLSVWKFVHLHGIRFLG